MALLWSVGLPTDRELSGRRAGIVRLRTAHPIARSAEPGEDWSWCYLDNVAFVVTRP
jgi:hypothetical protein